MLTSEIPFEKTPDGIYLLDVGAASFRLILGLLKGTILVESLRINDVELGLLKSTVDYLMLENLKGQLDDTLSMKEQQMKDIKEAHQKELNAKDQLVKDIKEVHEKELKAKDQAHEREINQRDLQLKQLKLSSDRAYNDLETIKGTWEKLKGVRRFIYNCADHLQNTKVLVIGGYIIDKKLCCSICRTSSSLQECFYTNESQYREDVNMICNKLEEK